MSWQPCDDPTGAGNGAADPVELTLTPRRRDLGGFEVGRLLPAPTRQMVGPFIFLDTIGPADLPPGGGIDVRPHPHIGLATVTYLFAGEIVHRDSLGSLQAIRPGDVNWMSAGRGIVHSERSAPETRVRGGPLHGLQAWVALPREHEEDPPAFAHHPAETLPSVELDGARVTLIAGSGFGASAPVAVVSPLIYADVRLAAAARLTVPAEHAERAVLLIHGRAAVGGQGLPLGGLAVLRQGVEAVVAAELPTRLVILGGAVLDGPRHVWWNFVSSARTRIEQAKADWKAGMVPKVPGETEFIPLPEG